MMEIDEFLCLNNCIVQPCPHQMANVVKIKPTRTCAKILKVRTYSLLLFSKETQWPKSFSCLEFGDVDITRRLSLAEY
jgi:hypothetical protein